MPDPDDDRKLIDERRVTLGEVLPRVGTEFVYLYDFGDDWYHGLLVEAILLPVAATHYPTCIGGERRAPPEDFGGPLSYEEYLKAMADPEHEEHENKMQ